MNKCIFCDRSLKNFFCCVAREWYFLTGLKHMGNDIDYYISFISKYKNTNLINKV